MALTGYTTPKAAESAVTATATEKAVIDAIASLRRRLAMEQDQQVDTGDINTEDVIRNTEREA